MGEAPEYTYYELTNTNRLDRIRVSNVTRATFAYDAIGRPIRTKSMDIINLGFNYDELGRLRTIIPEGAAAITDDYAPGEPDIAVQMDRSTSVLNSQRKKPPDFASRMDVYLSRLIRVGQFSVQNPGQFSVQINTGRPRP